MDNMSNRIRLTSRGSRGGTFYCVEKTTGKRTSLKTTNRDEARQIVDAKNQAERRPVLNLQIAKAYLAGADKSIRPRRTGLKRCRKSAPMRSRCSCEWFGLMIHH